MDRNSATSSFQDLCFRTIIVSCILHSISIPVLCIRIWSRSRPVFRLGPDDWTIVAAVVIDLAHWTLIFLVLANGLGRPSYYVAPEHLSIAFACFYFSSQCYLWAIGLTKYSIAYSFYRLRRDSMVWRWLLFTMMIFPLAVAITSSAFLFTTCRPLSFLWDMTKRPNAACFYSDSNRKRLLVTSSLNVVTDWILALLPITFVCRIQRSVRERIGLIVIMGLGVWASMASICKISATLKKKPTGDPLRDGLEVFIWCIVELQLGIIATCIPFIRHTVMDWLAKIGLFTSRKGPTLYHTKNQNSPGRRVRATPGVEFEEFELQTPPPPPPHSNVNLSEAQRSSHQQAL